MDVIQARVILRPRELTVVTDAAFDRVKWRHATKCVIKRIYDFNYVSGLTVGFTNDNGKWTPSSLSTADVMIKLC